MRVSSGGIKEGRNVEEKGRTKTEEDRGSRKRSEEEGGRRKRPEKERGRGKRIEKKGARKKRTEEEEGENIRQKDNRRGERSLEDRRVREYKKEGGGREGGLRRNKGDGGG